MPSALRLLFVAFPLTVACSSSSGGAPASSPDDTGAADGAISDAGRDDTASADVGADAVTEAASDAAPDAPSDGSAGSGTGTITGSVKGATFDTVKSAYWIGAPDNPATTAVYLVGASISCADISKSGWSHTIPTGTQIFEMIMTGTAPGTFKATTAISPPAGEAEVQYIFAQPTRNETRANGGTITLVTLTAKTAAQGTFSVTFPDGTSKLDGTFDAAYCGTGHEP